MDVDRRICPCGLGISYMLQQSAGVGAGADFRWPEEEDVETTLGAECVKEKL
jgi:hypothetical protein